MTSMTLLMNAIVSLTTVSPSIPLRSPTSPSHLYRFNQPTLCMFCENTQIVSRSATSSQHEQTPF